MITVALVVIFAAAAIWWSLLGGSRRVRVERRTMNARFLGARARTKIRLRKWLG